MSLGVKSSQHGTEEVPGKSRCSAASKTGNTSCAGVQEVVKDVLAFAEVAESGTPREGPLSPIQPPPLGQASSPPAYASGLASGVCLS